MTEKKSTHNEETLASVTNALSTIRELLFGWMEFTKRLPGLSSKIYCLKNNKGLAEAHQGESWGKELKERTEWELSRCGGLVAALEQHEDHTKKLAEAARVVCRFARSKNINTDPIKRLLELTDFESYEVALLMLSHVEDALTEGEVQTVEEEWLPAGKAVEDAQKKGYKIDLSWISRSAPKHRVRTRPRELPGNHKIEVDWNSLAGYLLREGKKVADEESSSETNEEHADKEEIAQRIQDANVQKRRERPLN